ncbi:MAG: DUF11 domain-containing protein [Caldilineaceae bacterium]
MSARDLAAFAFKQQKALLFLLLLFFILVPRLAYAQPPISANVTVIKKLNPPTDPGLFNLQVDGVDLITDIGNDGKNSTTVTANSFSVGETSGTGTDLANYTSTISCVNNANNTEIISGPGPTLNDIKANDGDKITCTLTNTSIDKGQLTLKKVLWLANDPGKFILQIDDFPASGEVGNDGSLGPQLVDAGAHTLRELAGSNTSLTNYNAALVCKADGGAGNAVPATQTGGAWNVNINAGDDVVCTLTNTRKTGQLTVVKALQPDSDSGKFDLQIDGVTYTPSGGIGDGGSTNAQTVVTGAHTVAELATAATNTQLTNYVTTLLCKDEQGNTITATPGSGFWTVTVAENSNIICTFTNARKGKLTVTNLLVPANDPGRFNLKIDHTTPASNVGNGGTTGPQSVSPGLHTVSETAGTNTNLQNYSTNLSCRNGGGAGDVVASDSTAGPLTVPISPGDDVVCVMTNTMLPTQLQLSKTDGGVVATPGSMINYTLNYTNTGSGIARSVVITENVPANTSFADSIVNWGCILDVCTQLIGDVNAGASGSVTFKVKVPLIVPAGVSQVVNTASIGDANVGNARRATIATPLKTTTGLVIQTRDKGVSVKPGDNIVYTLTYTNTGNQGTNGVVITETVPLYTTFAGNSSDWGCSVGAAAGAVCKHTVGSLNGGAGGSLDFVVRVVNPLPAGVVQVTNTAKIGHSTAINVAQSSPTTPLDAAPDLSIAKDDGGLTPKPSDTLVYTLTYANHGNQAATGVVVNETTPANTTFVANASSPGWNCVANLCTYAIGNLAAGASGLLQFAVRVNDPLPVGVSQVINQATIQDDGANGLDPNAADNTAVKNTPLKVALGLIATKQATLAVDANHDGEVSPGDTLAYSVELKNVGNSTLTQVRFQDTPDVHTYLAAGTPVQTTQGAVNTGNNSGDTAVAVAVGAVAPGATVQIRLRVVINSPLTAGVTEVVNQGLVKSTELPDLLTDDPAVGGVSDPTRTAVVTHVVLRTTLIDYLLVDANQDNKVSSGDTLLYRLTVANIGNANATDLLIEDTPDSHSPLVAGALHTDRGSIVTGSSAGDNMLKVHLSNGLPSGEGVTISFQVKVSNGITVSALSTQAVITAKQGDQTIIDFSDDPDTTAQSDPTVTPLNSFVPAPVNNVYMPLILR